MRRFHLWVMAGVDTRQLTPCDDPDHAWVKAVELNIKG